MLVKGVIKSTRREGKDKLKFKIIEAKTEEEYIVLCENKFLPIEDGDRIFADIQKKGEYFSLERHPFVILSDEPEDIANFFRKIVGKSCENVYDKISMFIRTSNVGSDSNVDYLNRLSMDYNTLGSQTTLPYLGVAEMLLEKILKKWYKGRILRQLYLLNLRFYQISDARIKGIDELELYNICLSNPYRIPSLQLSHCDDILFSQNKKPTAQQYYCGQILRWIYQCMSQRWSYVPIKLLLSHYPKYDEYKDVLQEEYDLVFDTEDLGYKEERVYYKHVYEAETYVAEYILKLLEHEDEESISVDFENDDIEYTEEQREAIIGSINNRISIITGPAGSGKSTVSKKIIETIQKIGKRVQPTAYTGKAVVRICQIMGKRCAETLDYLIAVWMNTKRSGEKINSTPFDYLIIDEATMCSTVKFYEFITQYTGEYRIILIGDENQLPPISPGSLFQQLLKTGKVPVFKLSTVHRVEDETSNILLNSTILIDNIGNDEIHYLKKGNGYFEFFNKERAPYKIIDDFYNHDLTPHDFKILCPYRNPLKELNDVIQELYREKNLEKGCPGFEMETITVKGRKWCIGDIIVVNENNYNFNIKNGQEGTIVDINSENITVNFKFYDCKVDIKFFYEVERDDLTRLPISMIDLAYAMTVHKSQGSEYKHVIFYVPRRKINKFKGAFLNVNLIYTAITRAKETCFCVGDKDTFYLSTKKIVPRSFEKLAERIGVENDEDYEEPDIELDFNEVDISEFM